MGIRDYKYSAFQYTNNELGLRLVLEFSQFKEPRDRRDAVNTLMDGISIIGDPDNWEPIEDTREMFMPEHEHDELCRQSCPFDPPVDEDGILTEMEREFDEMRFGGDPRDPATWHGHDPDYEDKYWRQV